MISKEIILTSIDSEQHQEFILDPVTHKEFYTNLEISMLNALLQQGLIKPEQYNVCMKLI